MRLRLGVEKIALGITEDYLLTRPVARRFVPLVNALLSDVKGEARKLEIDFEGILTADTSFIDELIIVNIFNKMKSKKVERVGVYVTNLSRSVTDNAKSVFSEKKVPLLFRKRGGEFELLGHLENNLKKILLYALNQNEVTAGEVSKHFKEPINVASTKLLRLFNSSLLVRKEEITEKGREYRYYSVF